MQTIVAPPDAEFHAAFVDLAKNDPSPIVRLALASSCQQMGPNQRWDILSALTSHPEDANDHNLPCMYWYAAEPLAAVDAPRAQTEFAALPKQYRGAQPAMDRFLQVQLASLGACRSERSLVLA